MSEFILPIYHKPKQIAVQLEAPSNEKQEIQSGHRSVSVWFLAFSLWRLYDFVRFFPFVIHIVWLPFVYAENRVIEEKMQKKKEKCGST